MKRAARSIVRAAARSPLLARRVFGIELPPIGPGERYFDLTTPALVTLLRRRVDATHALLDLGTGLFASIGLALWKSRGCRVTCADVDPQIVARAREVVALNQAPIEVVQSSLLDGVAGSFDFISFNPPYVPSAQVDRSERFPGQSDGGPGGLDVLAAFLRSFAERGEKAEALVGINGVLVPRAAVEAAVAAVPAVRLLGVERVRPLPADVYVLRRS